MTVVCRTPGPPYIPGQIIETEIIQMSLTGTAPLWGPTNLSVYPLIRSFGRITVINTDAGGNLTLGDSFFDVFVQVDLPMLGRSFTNQNAIRLQSTVTALPIPMGTNYVRPAGPPNMLLEIPMMTPAGWVCDMQVTRVQCGCCINLRGDPNGDGNEANIIDLNFAVNRIFRGGPPANCFEEGNPNGDGSSLNILDLNYFVNRIFRGGPMPVPCPL